MWNAHGLRSFAVDDFTIYSLFDGCSDETRARLKRGERNAKGVVIYAGSRQTSTEKV